ncbi:MAG: hypothetical protein WBF53_12625, partial [Litorimonas sp.]
MKGGQMEARAPASRDGGFAETYEPAGRLVGVICAAEEPSCHAQLLGATLRLAREAAKRGETVLLLDGTDGALMEAA